MAGELQETSNSSVLNLVLDLRFFEIFAYRRCILGQRLEKLRGIRIDNQCYERCCLISLAIYSLYIRQRHRGVRGWYLQCGSTSGGELYYIYITKYDKKRLSALLYYGFTIMMYERMLSKSELSRTPLNYALTICLLGWKLSLKSNLDIAVHSNYKKNH